jgi:hypothetical protein
MPKTRILLATLVATIIGFTIHVLYGQGLAMEYVQTAAQEGRLNEIIRQPYPTWLITIAAITALIPTFGKVLLYVLIQDRLPATGKTARGLLFGLVLLAIDDALLRIPIMSVVVGNPVDVMLVQSLESWIIPLIMGLVIALILPWCNNISNKQHDTELPLTTPRLTES